MAWVNISFTVAESDAEALADALLESGALSVDASDAHAGTQAEEPRFGEPGELVEALWARTRLAALFPEGALWEEALGVALDGAAWPLDLTVEGVADADWVRASQRQFGPVMVSERLWVVPSWSDTPVPGAINLRLDPGLAFGTGSHPTTLQCLRWLERHVEPGASVLDYGCGSGILAIACARLGAGPVTGVDIDPSAVEAAQANALANGVGGRFLLPDQLPEGCFDLVVANILANPLRVLAPLLASRTRPGGALLLSGILARQAADVVRAYQPWFTLAVQSTDDGWACVGGARRPDEH